MVLYDIVLLSLYIVYLLFAKKMWLPAEAFSF